MPGEEEERCHRANVKQDQDRRNLPVQTILAGLIAPYTRSIQGGYGGHILRFSYRRLLGRNLVKIAHMSFLNEAGTRKASDARIAELHAAAHSNPIMSLRHTTRGRCR